MRIALVTGAAAGIGAATADRLERDGTTVVRVDVDELDVRDPDQWQATVDDVLARHGSLDILVNNAGVGGVAALEDLTDERWQQVLAVNQTGTMHGLRHAAPRLADGGAVVNVSSIMARVAVPGALAYAATKGAVSAMTRAAAAELAPRGIRVNAVAPGFVATPMLERPGGAEALRQAVRRTPLGRVATADEIAAAITFLCSDDASYITGAELVVDGGYTAT